jgi:hypothetical protein
MNGPEMPPYIKPYREFQKAVKVGVTIRIKLRHATGLKSPYDLKETEGKVLKIFVNCFKLSGMEYPVAWFAVHDWEIAP